jgi:hypothetical protein
MEFNIFRKEMSTLNLKQSLISKGLRHGCVIKLTHGDVFHLLFLVTNYNISEAVTASIISKSVKHALVRSPDWGQRLV